MNTYLLATDGLCNRMRTIDSAITLSEKVNRNLKVIWVRNELLNSRFTSLFKTIEGIELIESSNNTIPGFRFNAYPKTTPDSKQGLSGVISRALWKYLRNKWNIRGTVFYDELLEITNQQFKDQDANAEQTGYKMIFEKISSSIDNGFSNYIASCWRLYPNQEFYARFIPVNEIQKRIDQYTSGFDNTIGLHIRRTDHKEAVAISGIDKFIDLIEKQIESNNRTNFFLATDDPQTEKDLKARFNGKIITNPKRSFSRNSEEGIKDAVVDLYCLSKTNKIFGSFRSSFSQVAADISGIEVESVK